LRLHRLAAAADGGGSVDYGGLIKKTESSWVKLKAFPTTVGRPKNVKDELLMSKTAAQNRHLQAYC